MIFKKQKMDFHKTKTIIISVGIFLTLFVFAYRATPVASAATAQFQYPLLETVPGFFKQGSTDTDLPKLILAIYKFGIWTVGIAGLFMLTIGGFMYMASAGNNATVTSAKGIIADSLLGIVAALGAYLIMYVINPDLTNINIAFTTATVSDSMGTPMGTIDSTTGKYQIATSGDCSAESLAKNGSWPSDQAACVCSAESGMGKQLISKTDKCTGNGTNDAVSIGLFQINLTWHKIAGVDCTKAFSGHFSGDSSACYVTDRSLYNQCVTLASDSSNNIAEALNTYKSGGNSWKLWGKQTKSGCGVQ